MREKDSLYPSVPAEYEPWKVKTLSKSMKITVKPWSTFGPFEIKISKYSDATEGFYLPFEAGIA